MSVRAIDFSSSAYAKTKSFKAKENVATASRIKDKRTLENPPSGVKSSWTPLKQDLNEKVDQQLKFTINKLGPSWSDAPERDWELTRSLCKMADGNDRETQAGQYGINSPWSLFFTDLDELLCDYEQHRSTNDIALKERLTIRLEDAVKALQNVSPYVSETNMSAVFEITRNFQLMFWDCHRGCEFPSRTRCSQVAVLSLSSPNRVDTGQVGRPKFDIKEETLVELRSLGFSWEDIARMLLVSRWTIHRRVSEFGLNHLSRFSDITDEQLDNKVGAFLREHGCLVGTSMILGPFEI
ncbi:hypothetical protein OS493_036907 [Desmophyllum pertusum]|uniref:Uncharacterized protein n=1 Tax=Desmophyllum pertusum TaxID=174260 RepID=A0A9X0CCL8_9CNID|nr:hypothetical protein OS493_036907 [Desmophyllum pertusum]